MNYQRQIPEFAAAALYNDPREHRCPHDAWLETLEVSEPAKGVRNEDRNTSIVIKLLGADHDGHIVFHYCGVTKYSLGGEFCSRGLGDWLEDEFSVSKTGLLQHRIYWAGFEQDRGSYWIIEAKDITCEWIPKSA